MSAHADLSARPPHVLVVEPDPSVAAFLREVLGRHYRVTRLLGTSEIPALLTEETVDLILLSCALPGTADRRLVAEADRAEVPVLLLVSGAEAQRLWEAEGRFCLRKPVRADVLRLTVALLLGHHLTPDL
jgi:DNA-binding response OmpR family regulator